MKSPVLELMKAERRPGCCEVCDQPISAPVGKRLLCRDPECKRTYGELWQEDRLRARRARTAARRALLSIPLERPLGQHRWRLHRKGALAA